eukprot:CAMPEP_0196780252 /NCGR_PEP_ID=MMETSP1104-20130614/7377_1 /TAXON_ID=33652 /ORGANISM="Cafeteria sp., Strain Caron Lab Isolate" /LENGTH=66 /DNA_ID=CAMNT_0042150449 /DNA_START=27 /DNA_END=227 /DNA_ORIENTATION=+
MDDEVQDPKAQLEQECHPRCTQQWSTYEECKARVEKSGEGDCSGWYFDYFKCIDKCVTPQLFQHLR